MCHQYSDSIPTFRVTFVVIAPVFPLSTLACFSCMTLCQFFLRPFFFFVLFTVCLSTLWRAIKVDLPLPCFLFNRFFFSFSLYGTTFEVPTHFRFNPARPGIKQKKARKEGEKTKGLLRMSSSRPLSAFRCLSPPSLRCPKCHVFPCLFSQLRRSFFSCVYVCVCACPSVTEVIPIASD